MYCTDCLDDILCDPANAKTRVFNLYGVKGVGKTHMLVQLMEKRRRAGNPCGYLDFDAYKGLSMQTTLNASKSRYPQQGIQQTFSYGAIEETGCYH